jgi:hypothetical protein
MLDGSSEGDGEHAVKGPAGESATEDGEESTSLASPLPRSLEREGIGSLPWVRPHVIEPLGLPGGGRVGRVFSYP